MIDKLEPNMYVRTKNGMIEKIISKEDVSGSLHREEIVFILDNGNRLALHSKKVIKASHNIIDLIEVGDYVNGNEIYKISWDSLGLILETTDYFKLREKDIKSILTKEQFESLEYKVD